MKAVLAVAVSAAVAGAMVATAPAANAMSSGEAFTGLDGPRGLAIGNGGKMVVAQADGTISKVIRNGPRRGKTVKIGKLGNTGLAPAVDIDRHGNVYALTTTGPRRSAAKLYVFKPGKARHMVADIGRYQKRHPDPFDLENNPGESNPYGVAALDSGGALVADAAGNDLLRVRPNGRIYTVAKVKPRVVKSPDLGEEGPPPGTRMPAEAVITSVTVGRDGAFYIGELRGFPGTVGTSQVWRIRPGARNAVCDPTHPRKGACKRFADGLTSVVDLGAGPANSIYALELSKKSWLAMESPEPVPGAEIGALIRLSRDRMVRHEIAKGRLVIPGGVEVNRRGSVFVTTPMFGPGRILRVR
ncbi:MAG TPA: ScyD/ScyE family protein [Nocardioidaceae bacterium]|nr:ScyD/ScyE family protein [Nocardioidaceae bacterium]